MSWSSLREAQLVPGPPVAEHIYVDKGWMARSRTRGNKGGAHAITHRLNRGGAFRGRRAAGM